MEREKYWILTEVEVCVVCGKEVKTRTRMNNEKPEEQRYRFLVNQTMCSDCKWLQ